VRLASDTDPAIWRREIRSKFRCLTPPDIEPIAALMENGGARGGESKHP